MFQNPHQVCAYTPSGDVLANYEAYSSALGIRTLSFYRPPISGATFGITSPATQLMAVGSYDGKIRLMSMTSWSPALLLPLAHPREMDAGVMSTTGEIVYLSPNLDSSLIPSRFLPPPTPTRHNLKMWQIFHALWKSVIIQHRLLFRKAKRSNRHQSTPRHILYPRA